MIYKSAILLVFTIVCVTARIHKMQVTNDVRRFIPLSTFGFYKGGILQIRLDNLTASPDSNDSVFGFSLDRTLNDAMNPYLDSHSDDCILKKLFENNGEDMSNMNHDAAVIYFILDLKEEKLIYCTKDIQTIQIYKSPEFVPALRVKRDSLLHHVSDTLLFSQRNKRHVALNETVDNPDEKLKTKENPSMAGSTSCSHTYFPIYKMIRKDKKYYYGTEFVMYFASIAEEGLYNLYFHSCPNYEDKQVAVDFTIEIQENNDGNFLSAGEMPLPGLYSVMALLFFLSGTFWVFILRKSKHSVYKIHYWMAVLIYLKSLSLHLHSMNYDYIERTGEHLVTWAILYYVAHLLKGVVLFITIVLIGTGWTFTKHMLDDRDKKILMIVIPLQVLGNIAEIICEEGDIEHETWRNIFIIVDFICCCAILFPVFWSIRHFKKVANNFRMLKLFRHFYIMIVCYIYFTRIIVYLVKINVPFQYEWLDEMLREMVTYVFFVLTGYKFMPAFVNPYFITNSDNYNSVLIKSGATADLSIADSISTGHKIEL